jgi:gliding motility-associated-like protein
LSFNIKHLIYILLFLNTSTFFGQINDPPTVTAVGDQIYCPQSQQRIVTFFDIVDPDDTQIPAFYIQISSGYIVGQDQLSLIGSHPTIVANWNANQAKLTLTGVGGGPATYTDMIAAVYDVVFNSTNINVTNKTFSLTAGSANYLASTDHYYDYVPANLITWTDAKTAAEAMDYFGLQGYLATLTIADEGQISGELSPGTGWIGASDAGTEGVWKWMTGPETGTTFWNGNENGSAAPGMYENWNSGEPNNYGGSEDYAHITYNTGIPGSWNDLPNDTNGQPADYQAKGFVIEYGGTPGDPVLNISGSTTFSPPLILSTSPSLTCENDPANLSATSNTTDILWYNSQNGGSLLFTGNNYNPVLTTTTTFWVLASTNGCTSGTRTAVTATVNSTPTVDTPANVSSCDSYSLPTLTNGNYFTASNGSGTSLNTGDVISASTTLFVYAESATTPNCSSEHSFDIAIIVTSNATFTQLSPICEGDSLTLPTTSIEGFTGTWSPVFDNTISNTYNFTPDANQCAIGTTMTITVNPVFIATFTPVDTICVGDVLLDLPTNSNNGFSGTWSPAVNNTVTTEYTFTPTPITGSCFEETKMTITVLTQTTPLFTQVDPICIGSPLTTLPTESNNGYTGSWSPAVNNLATTTYTFTPDPGQCADTTTMTIVVNPISILTITATNISEDFEANQIISVSATGGSGTYEYQLDSGSWQSSPMFEYVIGCQEHTVSVRDALGCSTLPEARIMIMEFPKFFTPNGDGYNDTWNIKCLRDDPSALISIFDRFGKLVFQFRPGRNAWNGIFNDSMLPATDYWFVVNYTNSNGVQTQYSSHFSLRH